MNTDLGRGGALGTVVGVFADLLLNSGEFLGLVAGWLVGNADLLLPIFSTMRGQIAPRVEWLPTGALDKAVFVFAVLFLGIMVYRLLKRTFGD